MKHALKRSAQLGNPPHQVLALARREEAVRTARAARARARPEQQHLLARLSREAELAALERERGGAAREAVEASAAAEAALRCAGRACKGCGIIERLVCRHMAVCGRRALTST